VLRIAHFDGLSVLVVAGTFALAAAYGRDGAGAGIGLAVAFTGALELHGATLIRNRDARGMTWLIASQLFLLSIIMGYAAWRLDHVDVGFLRPILAEYKDLQQKIREAGLTQDEYLRFLYTCTYAALGAATLLYQGGMALYYSRRRAAVSAALNEP
jgi:hypothetical protein